MPTGRLLLVVLAASISVAARAEDKPAGSPPAPSSPAKPPPAAPAPAVKAEPAAKPTPPAATDATVLDASALDAVIGRSVKSATGEDMGRIVDILVPVGGAVRAAVIDFGGFLGVGSRKIAVDWKALNFSDIGKSGNVIVALTRNQVRMAPEYKQGDPIVILEPTEPLAAAKSAEKPAAPPAAVPQPSAAPAPAVPSKPGAPESAPAAADGRK